MWKMTTIFFFIFILKNVQVEIQEDRGLSWTSLDKSCLSEVPGWFYSLILHLLEFKKGINVTAP